MALPLDIAIALVAVAPFLAALVTPLLQRAIGSWSGWVLAAVPAVIFAYLCGFIAPVASGERILARFDWVPAYDLALSFAVDGLGLTFALLVAGIGAFILVYSAAYLKGHPHQGRFLAFMLMFMGAMLGLVLADSTLVLYTFWELTSVTSFLLIGFDHMRQVARRAAIQALLITNIGGLALLAAAVLLRHWTGSWELSGLAAGPDLTAHPAYAGLLLLVLAAAFTKSAQFPLHFWLPNAMEAPTPVSAFLHSATMVQGGVYLLARLSPDLGGTAFWTLALVGFGATTMLWGGLVALRQTDLKQLLAQTTLASLGLLLVLIGIGTPTAIAAAIIYFVAHALYKAGLFLVVGIIDHGTGTRDLTTLGGLRDSLTATFLAAVLAAASMVGLPPLLGYFAKEEMYLALASGDWRALLVLLALVAGNALLAAAALAVALRPFMGESLPTPKPPHEAPPAMLAGPAVFGVLAVLAGLMNGWFAAHILAPATSAVAGGAFAPHLTLHLDPFAATFWLSILTWGLGGVLYWQLDRVRTLLRRLLPDTGWTFDRGFDTVMFGLIRLAAGFTRFWHHGRLDLYLVVIFALFGLALFLPLWSQAGLPALPALPALHLHEWGIVGLAAAGVITVLMARTRLFAILALGVQGLAVALLYLLFAAPDLAFTQLMVEVLTAVILALVMARLRLDRQDPREFEARLRDGGLALLCGLGVTTLLFAVLQTEFDPRLGAFFNAASVPLAHGHNVVNVILVDFRGIDTLGEISVVMTAGIAVLALIRAARRQAAATRSPAPRTRRRRTA